MARRMSYGEVPLTIGDKEYNLVVCMDAIDRIEKRFGCAILKLLTEIQTSYIPLESLCFIIATGAGLGAKGASDIKEDVFAYGTARITPEVMNYLGKLMNPTGKDADDDEEEASGE